MIWSLLLPITLLLQPASPASPAVILELNDHPDSRGTTLTVTSGRGASCTVSSGGADSARRCTMALPPDVATLTASGDMRLVDEKRRPRRVRGSTTFQIVDVGPLLAPLRDASRPLGARVRAFVAAKAAFDARHADLETAVVAIGESGPAKAVEIAEAEKRLGFRLPREYVELLRDVGQIEIDDSSTSAADEITNTWDAMLKQWGTPLKALEAELQPATRALFRATALVFTEVGDGLGGLLFHPAAPACHGAPAFYFVHQEDGSMNDPLLLKHADGSCRDYVSATHWLLVTQALARYEDGADDVILVDRSASSPTATELIPFGTEAFQLGVQGQWERWR
jgi:hypothetical protein